MKNRFIKFWEEKRLIFLFETANPENQEAGAKKMEKREGLIADEKLKDIPRTAEGADDLKSVAEKEGEKQVDKGQEKNDPRLSVLRGNENMNSERLEWVAQNRPELILGLGDKLKTNPDAPKLLDTAFQNAVEKNPGAALAFMHLCPSDKRDTYIKQGIASALKHGDPRLAAGYVYLLGDKDREAVMSIVKKADPDGYKRYSAAA